MVYKIIATLIVTLFCAITGHAMAAPAPVVATPTASIAAESQTNTINARRQELKDIILKNGVKDVGKTISAAKELIPLENPEDVIFLINLMIQNPKNSLAEKTQKTILGCQNKTYLATALQKAGQDKSAEVNITAANLLIDMKEELEGLKVMVSLIKKGVISSQIIDIMDRVPERQKLGGIKTSDGQMIYNNEIQQALQTIYRTDVYPKDVQVFALLMHAGYYGAYLNNDRQKIRIVFNEAEQTYANNAMDLLQKAVNLRGEAWGTSWEIIKELKESKYIEVASKAREINDSIENTKKKEWRKIISSATAANLQKRQDTITRYLYEFGDTTEEVKYLLKILKSDSNKDIKICVINSLKMTKNNELVKPAINEILKNNNDPEVCVWAINYLIDIGDTETALQSVVRLIGNDMLKVSMLPVGYLNRFAQKDMENKLRNTLEKTANDNKRLLEMRAYTAINLIMSYKADVEDYKEMIINAIDNEKTDDLTRGVLIMELGMSTVGNDQIQEIVAIIESIANSSVPKVAEIAGRQLKNIKESRGYIEKTK